MLIKTKPALQVYKMQGSIAALIDERAWSIMLKGEAVLVYEPDPERWTLEKNGQPIHTTKAARPEDATTTWAAMFPEFGADALLIAQGKETSTHWRIRPGFPVYLTCDRAKRRMHERAGRDTAKKIADYYRKLTENGIKGAVVAEELERFGMKKEGKD